MDKSEEKSTSTLINCILAFMFLSAAGIIFVAIRYYRNTFGTYLSTDKDEWAKFGDFLGGALNPALSFLALIALLLTIVLQSRELELTRRQLQKSAEALNDQSKTQTKQRFENTFFSLLDQHNKILEKLTSQKKIDGLDTTDISYILNQIIQESGGRDARLASVKTALKRNYNEACGHYFRVLYQLLKFIATNIPEAGVSSEFKVSEISDVPLSPEEKMYSNFVRSFLNFEVTKLLAINCYCYKGEGDIYWKFKLLVERYELLEHLSTDTTEVLYSDIEKFYGYKAFGKHPYILKKQGISNPNLEMSRY